jgi:hypothetical protein
MAEAKCVAEKHGMACTRSGAHEIHTAAISRADDVVLYVWSAGEGDHERDFVRFVMESNAKIRLHATTGE